SPHGEPLVADFGVVALLRPNAGDVTDPADLAHVAPELLDGQPPTAASDTYSLTSALFTLFYGLPAFVRPGDQSIIPVIKRISSDPLPDLAAKNVPAPVVDAISRGMTKDPRERHRNAQDLGRSLQQAQVALGLPVTEMVMLGAAPASTGATAATQRVASTSSAPPAPSPVTPPVPGGPAARPNRTPVIIAAAAVVVVIALIAFFATRGDGSKKVAASSSSSSATTTTTTKTTTTTATTAPSTTPGASDSTVPVTNNGGQLTFAAPTSWSDHDPTNTSSGGPSLRASTDLNEFGGGTYLQPGIEMVALDPSVIDPANLDAGLDAILNINRTGGTLATVCTRGTRSDFTPGGADLAEARLERLSGCGGGGDVIITAATNAAHSFTALVEVHVGNPPDDTGVDDVMRSFDVVKFP
ncbi:MAG TPA: hypothetical protein VGZ52_08340, partial [Acidimicrobiales bacterium]|nr:hypothetical protein [Acidimicrobiales bacterium]